MLFSAADLFVALYRCMSSQPKKRVFSQAAVDQLPVVTGLRALEAIQLRDSGHRSQVNLFESKAVGAWPEVLPGP